MLDTNVLVAALKSRHGASFKLVSMLDSERFEIAISVPLVLEYEDCLARFVHAGRFLDREVGDFLDYICTIAHRQDIFYLWRPWLPDPKDDMVLELAFAAGCEGIVTHNRRDFTGADRFGVRIYSPKEFLHLSERAR